jgi:hypothetical protein
MSLEYTEIAGLLVSDSSIGPNEFSVVGSILSSLITLYE